MNLLIEIILDILFEGAVEASASKRVPMALRVLLGVILLALCIAVIGLLFWVAIDTRSILTGVLAVIVLVSLLFLLIHGRKKRRKK